MKKVRWTPEEEQELWDSIKEYPYNRHSKFIEHSEKYNRSIKAVTYKYYQELTNPNHHKYKGTAFTLIGHSSKLDNRSIIAINTTKHSPKKVKLSFMARIRALLKLGC